MLSARSFDEALALLIEKLIDLPVSLLSETLIVIDRASGGGALHIGDHLVQFVRPMMRLKRHSSPPIASYRGVRDFDDVAFHESAKYATGKNICATFSSDLILALSQTVSGDANA
jgi:hypothetical protein